VLLKANSRWQWKSRKPYQRSGDKGRHSVCNERADLAANSPWRNEIAKKLSSLSKNIFLGAFYIEVFIVDHGSQYQIYHIEIEP
jgi:hypothetical protein